MTAALLERPTNSAPGRCTKQWCMRLFGCTDSRHQPGDALMHEGRPSSVDTIYSNTSLSVSPAMFTECNGAPCGIPYVNITLHSARGMEFGFSVEQANAISATLAAFASEETPVGTKQVFPAVDECGDPTGAILTICRLRGGTAEVGNGAPRYIALGDCEISFSDPDGAPDSGRTRLESYEVRLFAQYVAMTAAEVTR